MRVNAKVVQTTLTKDEYALLVNALSRRGMSIQEGLRKAALAMVDSELKMNPNDPFFKASTETLMVLEIFDPPR